jgi:hypothetical protein
MTRLTRSISQKPIRLPCPETESASADMSIAGKLRTIVAERQPQDGLPY